MIRLCIRIVIAAISAMVLAVLGVNGNAAVLQTLFTVLGIVFSISMSLLVSFGLSKILNKKIRNRLRYSITHARNMLLLDFSVSTFVLVVALIWKEDCMRFVFWNWCVIDIMLIAVVLVATSLIYEIHNFRKLHKLHTDIEDAVIAEEVAKADK